MQRSINRIDHFIWVVRPENIEKYVEQASALFGVEFEHMHGPTLAGTSRDAYVSFDAGLEFLAPLGADDPTSRQFLEFLDTHGEGPWGFVFGVSDLGKSTAHARNLGYPAGNVVQNSDPEVRARMMQAWTTRAADVQETYVGRFVGTEIMFGEIDYVVDDD